MVECVVDLLHEIGSMAAADPLHEVLRKIITLVTSEIECDSAFIYILENDELVLRASKNPRPEMVNRLKLRVGQGITGWTAQHHQTVVLSSNAYQDPRFKFFSELPEDRYEAFLSVPILCRGRVVGVINLQHRLPYFHTTQKVKLISTIGFLVGAEVELARLESRVSHLSQRLDARKLIDAQHRFCKKSLEDRKSGLPDSTTAKLRIAKPHPGTGRGNRDVRGSKARGIKGNLNEWKINSLFTECGVRSYAKG